MAEADKTQSQSLIILSGYHKKNEKKKNVLIVLLRIVLKYNQQTHRHPEHN